MQVQDSCAVISPVDSDAKAFRFVVNGRYKAHRIAGQQRYANELISRLGNHVRVLEPAKPLKGARGHGWEQTILPTGTGGELLWSPCQSGPAFITNQVVTFHDLFVLENPEWFSTGYVWWYKRMIPRLARTARHLIAVSEYTKSKLMSLLGVPDQKISAIHSGIGEEFCPQPAASVDEMKRRLRLPSGNYVLSVSSLEPRKNLPRVLQAWKAILPELPADCWLVLAGGAGSPGAFAAENIDRTTPRVHFTGYVDDALLPALYSGARAFVYPSLAEGFGLPVLEAMRCGTPSLTAETSSLPEVTGGAALLVNPLDPDQIARGLLSLLKSSSTREALSRRGLERARSFRWDRCASETLEAIHKAAQQTASKQTEKGSV